MAEMNIKAIVTGEEDIKKLGDSIETVSKKTKGLEKSMGGVSAKSVALGNIYATLAEKAVDALGAIISAGSDYHNQLEEINGVLVTTASRQDELANAFGMASNALLENIGAWDAYNTVLEVATDNLKLLAGAEAIYADARAKIREDERQWAIIDAKNKEAKEKKAEQHHRNEMKRKKAEYDADVRQQKNLSRIEAIVAKEMAEKEAKIKAEEKAYEDLLVANDAWVDSVNEAVDAQIELSQAMDGSSESIDKQTDSITSNTEAQKSGGVGTTFQSDGKKISGAESYAIHALGHAPTHTNQSNGNLAKYLEDIARNTRQTNQYLGGI